MCYVHTANTSTTNTHKRALFGARVRVREFKQVGGILRNFEVEESNASRVNSPAHAHTLETQTIEKSVIHKGFVMAHPGTPWNFQI